ncbi:MAG: TetR/AcrR family transcriptional regulator C-terminal domain-containing protein [Eggerthellales bacterium]|nr:TetR/AcrR family transcriptional regulator C-terminal domain-containing protein [Eggerthellales bacterium]
MSAFDTKYLIAKTFIDLCEESSIRKVSISDIIKKTGKNRKTFYYHFVDKNSLIMWIFRYDLGKKLKERFPESMLVYEEPSDDSKSAFPYYILKKSGVRSLNHSAFFECFASVLEDRRRFYNQALLENGPQSLRNYLYDLYLPAMVNDINIILANRYLPEENIQFLAEFYTCAFLYYFIRKIDQPSVKHLVSNVYPFGNIIHSSLEMEIKQAQMRRNL